jgi:hypothetical protein
MERESNEQKQVEKLRVKGDSPNPARAIGVKGSANSGEKKNAGCRSYESASGLCALIRTGEAAFVCFEGGPV